jgi:predicted RNA-binding protein with PUA-like domain
MKYWLMKSEPNVYSIADLEKEQTCIWDGVRNYQAGNFLKTMNRGDLVFFYHSNTKPPGIVGLAKVIANNVIDPTQFDENSKYYDPRSKTQAPRWLTVSLEFIERFTQPISLISLKQKFTGDELLVVRHGNRLSVMPVAHDIAEKILQMRDESKAQQR